MLVLMMVCVVQWTRWTCPSWIHIWIQLLRQFSKEAATLLLQAPPLSLPRPRVARFRSTFKSLSFWGSKQKLWISSQNVVFQSSNHIIILLLIITNSIPRLTCLVSILNSQEIWQIPARSGLLRKGTLHVRHRPEWPHRRLLLLRDARSSSRLYPNHFISIPRWDSGCQRWYFLILIHIHQSPYNNLDVDFLQKLYDQGARNLWIHNTGPLGCLPQNIATYGGDDELGCVTSQNQASKHFNLQLHALCKKLQGQYQDVNVTYVDIYSIKSNLIANYSRYGNELQKSFLAPCWTIE